MPKRSLVWWNAVGIVVFVAGFVVGSIDMATSMGGRDAVMTIAAILQVVGGIVAVVAFTLEMRRRWRFKRQERLTGP